MTAKTRLCQRCKAEIPAERVQAVPKTRLCAKCAAVVQEKYGGEFRQVVRERKLGRPGGLKKTGVDYEVKLVRNPKVPDREDE